MRRLALLAAAGAAAGLVVARRNRNWGATREEQATAYPGDELIDEPADTLTRAVTVATPASEVWRWLVQIGQGRGGMYSYDWLENLIGLDIHSADEIRPEWQELLPGDRIVLMRPGYLGIADGYALPVERVDPPRCIVTLQQPPEHPWHAVWSFQVVPVSEQECRLISRSRSPAATGPAAWVGELMDPITLVMTRKMLLGIKARAEGRR